MRGLLRVPGAGTYGGERLHATVEVYEVVRAGPLRTHFQLSTRRGLTKFVGREREMEALKHAAARARSGHGQIVAAMAK
ncbi:MAG TPA: hypothetical protein VGI47_09735, partial [Candidatus Binataceae bacterium]